MRVDELWFVLSCTKETADALKSVLAVQSPLNTFGLLRVCDQEGFLSFYCGELCSLGAQKVYRELEIFIEGFCWGRMFGIKQFANDLIKITEQRTCLK